MGKQLTILAGLCAILLTASAWAGPPGDPRRPWRDVEIHLEDFPALHTLSLDYAEGKWHPHVFGYAGHGGYSTIENDGTVRAEKAGERVRLAVDMEIYGKNKMSREKGESGEPARFVLTLDLDPEKGTLSGSYAARFKGKVHRGDVSGTVGPVWPALVEGWKPLKPGEHPRLIFREGDLPRLRERAKTEAGQVIVRRCKAQLAARPYTTWHAAGYAFLHQLTGEKKYADRAREMVEKTLGGAKDPDGRYSWPGGGQLRAGPCMAALALAYDMGYDGWDEAFRKQAARGIMANRFFEPIANRPRHCPGCNHWGALTGGLGVALLALRGDPEVDTELIERRFTRVLQNAKRGIVEGFGERGYFYEGHHCGRLASNTGLVPFIQACRVAAGKDLIAGCDNARWLLTRWACEFVDDPGAKPRYDYVSRGMYRRDFRRSQASEGGDFSQGFGICSPEHKPAVLWVYNHRIEPGEKTYDVTGMYPHLAAYALANWPIDAAERNPDKVFPRVLHDRGPNYFVFRSGWSEGGGEMIVTALLGSRPQAGRGMAAGGSVVVAGKGLKYTCPGIFHSCRLTYHKLAKDGSGVISAVVLDEPGSKKAKVIRDLPKKPTSLAVDYSGASGAELMVAQVGPLVGYRVEYWMNIKKAKTRDVKAETGYFTKTTEIELGGARGYVMTLQKDGAPAPKVEGDKLLVGDQTVTFDGEKLILAEMAAP